MEIGPGVQIAEQRRLSAIDPATPPEHLAYLIPEYPSEILANPVFPLLLLEDPARWIPEQLRARCYAAQGRLNDLQPDMTDVEARLFAADCAERVLWIFERASSSP